MPIRESTAKYHLLSTMECTVFAGIAGELSKLIKEEKKLEFELEVLLLRKIMQESGIIRDFLKGKAPKITPIIIRNAYESFVYWKFLTSNKNKRFYALAYLYEDTLFNKSYVYDEFDEEYPINKVNLNHQEIMVIKSVWESQRKSHYKDKRIPYPKWYLLKGGPINFSRMNKDLGLHEEFKKIYSYCSKVNHGMGLINDYTIQNNIAVIDAVYNIDPTREKYLWFLSYKMMSKINNDVYEYYKEKLEQKGNDFIKLLREPFNIFIKQLE